MPQCGGNIRTVKGSYYGHKYVERVRCSTTTGYDELWVKYQDVSYICSTEGCPETYTETKQIEYVICNH